MAKRLCLLILLVTSVQLKAQQLDRVYYNGIAAIPVTDSIARLAGYSSKTGLLVQRVVPEGTASKAGILVDDIIFSLNDKVLSTIADLRSGDLATLKENRLVTYKVWRNGAFVSLNATSVSRPQEMKTGIDYSYGAIPYQDGLIRSLISAPAEAEGKLPAILFIQGYTCAPNTDLDERHPYRRLTDGLSLGGYLVMRIEKPGMGDNENTPPCDQIDIYQEAAAFESALLALKNNPNVDTNQIFIWGHSMGGIIAPLLASKHPWVKGVSVYGTTYQMWGEYIVNMTRIQSEGFGMDPVLIDKTVRDMRFVLHEIFTLKKSPSAFVKEHPEYKQFLMEQFTWSEGGDLLFTRSAAFNQTLDGLNLAELWSKTEANVLAFYGEADIEALNPDGAKGIVNIVNRFHEGNGTYYFLPGTDHSFAKVGSIEDGYRTKADPNYYYTMLDQFNPEVISVSLDWLKSIRFPNTHVFDDKAEKANEAALKWVKLATEPYNGKQDDIVFVDELTGWYVNGFGAIYHTEDGGKTWEKQLEKKGSFFRTIAFIDKNVGFVGTVGTDYFPNVTDTIPLYGTVDGGKTWNPVAYSGPYVKGLCAIDVVKEQYINHGQIDYNYHLYAVGRVGSPANMMVSHDSGKTWVSYSMKKSCKMLFDIKMLNKNEGFACAASNEDVTQSHAVILKTTNGGKKWKKVYESDRPFETTWKASFPSDKVGYVTIQSYNPDATVSQQRIAKTIDGGKTWNELNLVNDAGAREFGIGFLDENHGFVGTVNSGYETVDGGATWTPIDLGRACNKIRIYVNEAGKQFGFAIGVSVLKLAVN
jgi:photosystem II stability/assembly factor-like uncharacterized protein/pimeloyl-ACP methyl ester carboxylesterase